ncbi:MAG: hypothetical protein HYY40_03830 [Bacteroidetes bacterium]|nr:hypothetical protein [Bacteroidota bacterium]
MKKQILKFATVKACRCENVQVNESHFLTFSLSRFPLFLLIANCLLPITDLFSQNIGINLTGASPDGSSGLDVDFTDKGVLIPRIALTQTSLATPVTSPATSLLVYNTASVNDVTPGYYYWNGSAWMRLLNGGSFGGTTDYLARWLSATDLGTGITRDNGTYVGIGSAPSTSYRLLVTSANSAYDAVYGEHTSGSVGSVYNGVSGKVVNAAYTTAQGYLAYHASNNNTYALYGKGGNWGGYFDNKVVIGNSTPGTINTGDLEVQNITAGSGNAATLTLRQTTSNVTSGNLLSNINFGDNYQANPQAQIQAIRGAASSGATDLPSDILFYTIDDASTSLTERMRIRYSGFVGIGTPMPNYMLDINLGGSQVQATGNGINANGYQITNTDVSTRSWGLWALGNSGLYGSAKSFAIYDQTAAATRLLINTSGDVGIGNTSPGAKLEVTGQVKITGGSPGSGKVLYSDAVGLANWGGALLYDNNILNCQGSTTQYIDFPHWTPFTLIIGEYFATPTQIADGSAAENDGSIRITFSGDINLTGSYLEGALITTFGEGNTCSLYPYYAGSHSGAGTHQFRVVCDNTYAAGTYVAFVKVIW